jgi:cytochrome c oxidase cbb3-type subunit 4
VDASLLRGLYTALLLVLFIGICFWAWSGKRKAMFDDAARRPLEPDNAPPSAPQRRPDL